MTKARDIASATPAPSTVSATELGYVDGVTSAIQTQLDAKLASSTAASTYQAINSNVSTTELGYLDGVTSAIQTQLNAKISNTLTTTTGDTIYASGANTPARLAVGSTGQVLTVAGGVPTWATPAGGSTFVGVYAHGTGYETSVPNNTVVLLPFTDEIYDTHSFHSTSVNPSRLTIPAGKDGYYFIFGKINYTVGGYSKLSVSIQKNYGLASNDSLGGDVENHVGGDFDNEVTCFGIRYLVAGDYLELQARQISGTSLNAKSFHPGMSHIGCFRIGD